MTSPPVRALSVLLVVVASSLFLALAIWQRMKKTLGPSDRVCNHFSTAWEGWAVNRSVHFSPDGPDLFLRDHVAESGNSSAIGNCRDVGRRVGKFIAQLINKLRPAIQIVDVAAGFLWRLKVLHSEKVRIQAYRNYSHHPDVGVPTATVFVNFPGVVT